LLELNSQLCQEVQALLTLGEPVDQGERSLPAEMVLADEVTIRQERLANLAKAKAVLEARAQERYAAEQAEYQAKLREREEKARAKGRKPGGRPPQPPQPGARDQDQYNFTDPDSRIMKNSTDHGFDQHYNVQAVVDQASLLVVATSLSNHPNDQREAKPALDAISPKSASLKRRRWTTVTGALPISRSWKIVALRPILPPDGSRIIRVGKPSLLHNLLLLLTMPPRA
jgi:hypothetical protein